MILRASSLFGITVAVYGLVACSDAATSFHAESVGATAEPILFGSSDSADDDRVVQIVTPQGSCTGTLIALRVVLTASSCLRGNSATGQSFREDRPMVYFGLSVNGPRLGLRADGASAYIDRQVSCDSAADSETDVALVYLPSSIEVFNRFGQLKLKPLSETVLSTGNGLIAGFAPENLQNGVRQIGSVTYERMGPYSSAYYSLNGAFANAGDVGGPLFTSDGNVIGVVGVKPRWLPFSMLPFESVAADVSYGIVSDWIDDHARDHTRSLFWMDAHEKEGIKYWLGDYGNPYWYCLPDVDPDCDSWTNQYDNCPSVTNIDQLDSNNDGVGDACSHYAAGSFALVETDPNHGNSLYQYGDAPNVWSPLGDPGAEFAINRDGVFGFAADHSQIWRYSTDGWHPVSTVPAQHIFAGGHQLFATSLATGRLSILAPDGWHDVGLPGAQFVVNEEALYGLSGDGSETWRYRNGAWDRISSTYTSALRAGGTILWTTVYGSAQLSQVFDGSTWSTFPFHFVPRVVAISPSNSVYMIYTDSTGAVLTSQYDIHAKTLNRIGGFGTNLYLKGETLYEENGLGDLYRYNGRVDDWTLVRRGAD